MAPVALKKLTTAQNTRSREIKLTRDRIEAKPRDSLNANTLQSRIDEINSIWSEIRQTHLEIMNRDGVEAEPYVVNDVFMEMKSTYEDALDYFKDLRSELQPERRSTVRSRSSRSRSSSASSGTRSRPAKLPKVDLPTFSGKEEDWDSFCDLFTSLVHNVRDLDDSTKLQYLKSCLAGDAAEWVKDVRVTDANYLSTWEGLKERFYDPRLTINTHLESLTNLPYLTKESAVELRSLADKARHAVSALASLKAPVQDMWLVFVLSTRLDPESRKMWEAEVSKRNRRLTSNARANNTQVDVVSRLPTYEELADFLTTRIDSLKVATNSKASTNKQISGSRRVHHAHSSGQTHRGPSSKCTLCPGIHGLAKCPVFLAKTPHERRSYALRFRRCFNCLGPHMFKDCTSKGRCGKCSQKHHTLIHGSKAPAHDSAASSEQNTHDEKAAPSAVNVHTANVKGPKQSVILATAQVNVTGPRGTQTRARALLDQGSESSFISESLAQLLELPRQRVNIKLNGVGGSKAGTVRATTIFTLQSLHHPEFRISTDALVLPRLTSQLPSREFLELDLGAFAELTLADPHFHIPDSVDLILGADVYGQLLRAGVRSFPSSRLVAQETALGWIVSGSASNSRSRRAAHERPSPRQVLHSCVEDNVSDFLPKFWELEEVPRNNPFLKPEDEACEKLFVETHTRDATGRFIVRLPIKTELPQVAAETRRMALSSLGHMHRRFSRDQDLAQGYRAFMTAYEQLGHMSRVPASELDDPSAWYLPHHAVSNSSKLRVVFDASRQTREKHCLNDFLASGPPLQRELPLVLLNWRRYQYVFTADIVKMFRMIMVAKQDRRLQRIVWAPGPDVDPVDFYLDTVTYGTTCAPYLALRTLIQLARDERPRFPLGASCVEDETYVDDTFAGADKLAQAVRKRQEFTDLLKSGGFELDKWAANHPDILSPHIQKNISAPKELDRESSVKTLGVQWNPARDEFSFHTQNCENQAGPITKRTVLSNIARLFDPLGWLSPVTVIAKILMQDLWILKCDWDAPLPSEVAERWSSYCESLTELKTLSIRRWLGTLGESTCQIHGFSDASARAYAAAVYIRVKEENGQYRTSLLAAKTKVAPVKTVSIPNLELCGAALLVKLVCYLRTLDFLKDMPLFMWSDSEIVLRWLSKHPCHWKTFVANRVSQIQTELPTATWAHVPTKENPADIATRGTTPAELRDSELWWRGPSWLSQSPENWPQPPRSAQVLHVQPDPAEPEILTRFSSLKLLTRVVAYCLRPLTKLRRRRSGQSPLPPYLTVDELREARAKLIRCAQTHAFAAEIKIIRTKKQLPKHSPLLKLKPIISEEDGLLRVGGRLSHSNLAYQQKHPPILPRKSALSRLFIRHAHEAALHGGPTLTSTLVMRHVWIIGRRPLVKTLIRNCIKCQRAKPRLAHQLMGDLPEARVNQTQPFTHTGIDYAGPFQLRTTKGRGHRAYKGYIALFICLVTRAIHLEAVSDLTTATFIAAYRRFKNRRGTCLHLYSDNSTTFRGADRELRAMFNEASAFYASVAETLATDGTKWTFIPPTTPHYGGLWEAGVKSAKHHLKRAFSENTFTFEEFTTVLTEIEACLNSRPLSPFSDDIDDLNALTPAHFLINRTPGCVPDAEPPLVPENRLNRYQLMQRVRGQFWKRWSTEYLQHLQERAKWRDPTENFAVGQLVLLRDERYPPTKWPLGRVIEVHPGPDGLVRVVTVKTACNTLRRHIARLSPLSTEVEQHP